ncbi:TauD/TfdA family dioxygenase [Catenuloplanes indicus]|uniref:L-asparagine oxygenase n=1 Tax=Catenuloplanes indicus TaxID=137267 RepID=A0AAE3VT97_9ACTN|nr:TauD/TfdA family dioxygenase [Catenuloplanes indicus]MDQ0363883.1 L-asparagine oxygenase [Catenuloplanes indicus]
MTTAHTVDRDSGAGRPALDDNDRAALARLADDLAATAPGRTDDPDWVAAARRLSNRLPLSLLDTLRSFRADPGPDGVLLLRGLPLGADLPPTPSVPESVERRAARPSALIALIGMALGELAAYRDEKSGALVQNVVPVPGREESQSNAGSTMLEMHIENAFHPYRPDLVGLLCLRNDHDDLAGLRTASIRRAVALLDAPTLAVLREPRFRTAAPPSFHDLAGVTTPHPLLAGAPEDPDLRVDFTSTAPDDPAAEKAMSVLGDALSMVAETVILHSGDLAWVDNRVTIHGRTAFTPRYDGRDRWLHRCFVHLDRRRSRGARPGDGSVLI